MGIICAIIMNGKISGSSRRWHSPSNRFTDPFYWEHEDWALDGPGKALGELVLGGGKQGSR